jgi:hypothetical protein
VKVGDFSFFIGGLSMPSPKQIVYADLLFFTGAQRFSLNAGMGLRVNRGGLNLGEEVH